MGQQRASNMIIVCIWEMICIDLSFFSPSFSFFLSFLFLLRLLSLFLSLFFIRCLYNTYTDFGDKCSEERWICYYCVCMVVISTIFSSSWFNLFAFSSVCCCCSCLIDIICSLRSEERISLLVRRTALFSPILPVGDCRCS